MYDLVNNQCFTPDPPNLLKCVIVPQCSSGDNPGLESQWGRRSDHRFFSHSSVVVQRFQLVIEYFISNKLVCPVPALHVMFRGVKWTGSVLTQTVDAWLIPSPETHTAWEEAIGWALGWDVGKVRHLRYAVWKDQRGFMWKTIQENDFVAEILPQAFFWCVT